MRFSEEEITQLLKAWLAISFAFAVGLTRFGLIQGFVIAGITVGVAFVIHELAHKVVAQNYGCWAEFRSFDLGLLLAVLMSVATGGQIIFAAPGAVMISGSVSTEENGKISVAGPITNIILALIFIGLRAFATQGMIESVFISGLISYGVLINAWLALFNLFPFGPLDGTKVLNWSQPIWLTLTAISAGLVFLF